MHQPQTQGEVVQLNKLQSEERDLEGSLFLSGILMFALARLRSHAACAQTSLSWLEPDTVIAKFVAFDKRQSEFASRFFSPAPGERGSCEGVIAAAHLFSFYMSLFEFYRFAG